MAAVSALRLRAVDDEARRREAVASRGQIVVAQQASEAIADVTRKFERMNQLYRERLIGSRERREGVVSRRDADADRRGA